MRRPVPPTPGRVAFRPPAAMLGATPAPPVDGPTADAAAWVAGVNAAPADHARLLVLCDWLAERAGEYPPWLEPGFRAVVALGRVPRRIPGGSDGMDGTAVTAGWGWREGGELPPAAEDADGRVNHLRLVTSGLPSSWYRLTCGVAGDNRPPDPFGAYHLAAEAWARLSEASRAGYLTFAPQLCGG